MSTASKAVSRGGVADYRHPATARPRFAHTLMHAIGALIPAVRRWMRGPFPVLPTELWLLILDDLPLSTLVLVSRVCWELNDICIRSFIQQSGVPSAFYCQDDPSSTELQLDTPSLKVVRLSRVFEYENVSSIECTFHPADVLEGLWGIQKVVARHPRIADVRLSLHIAEDTASTALDAIYELVRTFAARVKNGRVAVAARESLRVSGPYSWLARAWRGFHVSDLAPGPGGTADRNVAHAPWGTEAAAVRSVLYALHLRAGRECAVVHVDPQRVSRLTVEVVVDPGWAATADGARLMCDVMDNLRLPALAVLTVPSTFHSGAVDLFLARHPAARLEKRASQTASSGGSRHCNPAAAASSFYRTYLSKLWGDQL